MGKYFGFYFYTYDGGLVSPKVRLTLLWRHSESKVNNITDSES